MALSYSSVFMMALIIAGAIALVAIVAIQLRKYTCYRHELGLKRELVERGLSIDEIERVVAAKSSIE